MTWPLDFEGTWLTISLVAWLTYPLVVLVLAGIADARDENHAMGQRLQTDLREIYADPIAKRNSFFGKAGMVILLALLTPLVVILGYMTASLYFVVIMGICFLFVAGGGWLLSLVIGDYAVPYGIAVGLAVAAYLLAVATGAFTTADTYRER